MTCLLTGITISKNKLQLTKAHFSVLESQNIGITESVSETGPIYILYYKPAPCTSDPQVTCHLKGLLTRIRSDEIYLSYNDDFKIQGHLGKIKPIIKTKK